MPRREARGEAQAVATSFDFLIGEWRVRNRRRATHLPEEAGSAWAEFDSVVRARPILGGLGVADTYRFPDFPGRGEFHGFALRLVDPATDTWRVWWASSASGGLDPPVVGRFVDGEGVFAGPDSYGGREVVVRTRYCDITPTALRWEQAFSFDGGASFHVNWVMEFERVV